MQPIRSSLKSRLALIVVAISLLSVTLLLINKEKKRDWKHFQAHYRTLHLERLQSQIQLSQASRDKSSTEKWQALYQDVKREKALRIRKLYLPDANVRDLCKSCHVATENRLFADTPNPLRYHPEAILKEHSPNRFGCTLCHQGQGPALSVEKAHGFEANWLLPRVPAKFVQGLCLGCHDSPYGLRGAEKAETGRQLFVRFGCFGCHKARALDYPTSFSTPLNGIGKKIANPSWLFAWLKRPAGIRPGTRMPSFRVTEGELVHMTSYLLAQKVLPKEAQLKAIGGGSRQSGKSLFTEKGCIACHSVEHGENGRTPRVPNVADAGFKLSRPWIAAWLADPSKLDPTTLMPRVLLRDGEQRDLVAFLAGQKAAAVRKALNVLGEGKWDTGNREEGRRLVQQFGCYGCHPLHEMAKLPLVGVEISQVAHKRIEELPFGNASVPHTKWDWLYYKIKQPDIYQTEDMPLKMPDYGDIMQKMDQDITALTVYYLHNAAYKLPDNYHYKQNKKNRMLEKGSWMVEQLNCQGCHQFNKDETPRLARFVSLKSMTPPRLVGEGERVQPQWLFQYLSRPTAMRPWLKTRMPEFNWSYTEKREMIEYFALQGDGDVSNMNQTPYVELPVRSDYDPEIFEMGTYRITTDKCMQCHPVSMDDKLPPDVKEEDLSINLMLSKKRLRYEWIQNFLRNPDRYAGKETKMPFVYYTPDRVPRMPDPEMWIQYTALALMFMDVAPAMPAEEQIEDIRPGSDVDWTSY